MGTASRGCGKLVVGHETRPLGLKPALILETLRGAEAPLFHGATRIRVFLRSRFQPCRYGSTGMQALASGGFFS
jgi:hypothetical protein